MTKVARPYFQHLKLNRNSLLARIYGVYTVKIQGLCPVHLMLMAHTMQIQRPDLVQRVFDLKGSTVDRKTKVTKHTSRQKTLKDENFIAMNRSAGRDLVVMFESDRAFVEQ